MFEDNITRIAESGEALYPSFSTQQENAMLYEFLTLERLKEVLAYNQETGIFTWKVRPHKKSRRYPGDEAGLLKSGGYRYIGIDGRTYVATQLAWFYVTGEWARGRIMLKNEDPSDCRFDNLAPSPGTGKRYNMTLEGRTKYRRDHKEAHPHIHRGYAWKSLYGVTAEDYQRMFLEQGGNCAICKRPERAKSDRTGEVKWLSVDHDHGTNVVRELLCSSCNHTLGHVGDVPELLEAAAAYLRKHKAKEPA